MLESFNQCDLQMPFDFFKIETLMVPTSPIGEGFVPVPVVPMSCHIYRCRRTHQEPPSMPSFVELDHLGPSDSQQPTGRKVEPKAEITEIIGFLDLLLVCKIVGDVSLQGLPHCRGALRFP